MMHCPAGSAKEAGAAVQASLLTRCPIHARRIHRIRIRPGAGGDIVARIVSGGACCGHMRYRRLAIHATRKSALAALRLVLGV